MSQGSSTSKILFAKGNSMEERRQYYRIDDEIALRYERIDADVTLPTLEDFQEELPSPNQMMAELHRLQQSQAHVLRDMKHNHSPLGDYLDSLERQIDTIARFMVAELTPRNFTKQEVCLSGGGIAINSDTELEINQRLRLEFMIYPSCRGVCCIANVVHCQAVANRYRVGLEFLLITEPEREALVSHIMARQSKQLRNKTPDAG